jgi:hypothetical protein
MEEVDVAHRPSFALRISKPDILEREAGLNWARHWARAGNAENRGLHVEEHEEIAEIQALLVDAARRHEQLLNQVAALRRNEAARNVSMPIEIAPATARISTVTYAP